MPTLKSQPKNRRETVIIAILALMCSRVSCLTTTECLALFDTPAQGAYVCSNRSDLVPALESAEKIAREVCETAFQNELWNCSGFSILKAPNICSTGVKEAGYLQALSLAAIAYSVAKDCALGKATSCSCTEEDLILWQESQIELEVSCSDNIEFGVHFARNFLSRRPGGDIYLPTHNLMVGALVLQQALRTAKAQVSCRCHGVSGACTIQTCKYELANFTIIGNKILQLYQNHTCNATQYDYVKERFSFFMYLTASFRGWCKVNEIVYSEDSPDYCLQKSLYNSLGITGRVCDPHGNSSNSCNNLCAKCDRTYRSITHQVRHTCRCKFELCCDIRCDMCSKIRQSHTCI